MPVSTPQQIEFARGNLDYTVMSKRKLLRAGRRTGSSTAGTIRACRRLSGVRRRGFPPAAIRAFWERAGVTKQNSRDRILGARRLRARRTRRARAAPHGGARSAEARDHESARRSRRNADVPEPSEESRSSARATCRSRASCWIEREDFMEMPPKGFHRLVPGGEVRLRGVGIVKCEEVDKGCRWQCRSRSCAARSMPARAHGMPGADRKVKGTIHWVSARHAIAAEVRLYDRLFNVRRSGRRQRRQDLPRPSQSGFRARRARLARSRRWPTCEPEQRSSSSGSAISSPTGAITRPASRCSTAP